MRRVDVAPEHVLQAVGTIEDHHTQPPANLVQRVEEHRLALAVGVQALLQEPLVAQDVLVDRPGVLGQTECGKRPCRLVR